MFNKDYRGHAPARRRPALRGRREALGCSLLALREKANMQGLLDMGADPDVAARATSRSHDEAAIEALEKEWCVVLRDLEGQEAGPGAGCWPRTEIKVAIVLGEDPLGNPEPPGRAAQRPAGRRLPRRRRRLPDGHRPGRQRRAAALRPRRDQRAP